ncbi:hypothetical protein KIW84_042909 [Lathyrus oleraceus]|uniref:Uncharacterized protein n=1 Tax=Pisum sativum TaxID=3888 RepID=A0A9D4XDM9_PEA|nr:hypothetical protein KIW84_042909 [Pisum sativum]
MDSLYDIKWNFSNLENAFEEGGLLSGKKVYLFGCTEPQLVMHKQENKVICIPIVVAVVSPFPPSDKIGISSIQREAEEIIPMKQMKMDWVPYIPLEDRDSQVESHCFIDAASVPAKFQHHNTPKDVEVVPVSSTLPPEPPVSVAVESQPPILPLPVTSRPTHRDLQVKSSPPVQPTAPTNARPVMPFPLPGQRTVKLAREN